MTVLRGVVNRSEPDRRNQGCRGSPDSPRHLEVLVGALLTESEGNRTRPVLEGQGQGVERFSVRFASV